MTRAVITLADLETAVPLDRALIGSGIDSAVVVSLDEGRAAIRHEHPALLVLSGAVHEPPARALATFARDHDVAVLALLEATDSTRADRATRVLATEQLVKPIAMDDLLATVRRMIDRRELQRRIGLFGESAPIQEVLVKVEQIAPVSSTVLVEGESGTGKELVARAIHDLSPRRGRPFIAVNCAALPETLLESELFGHEKGAFTGAAERRLGRFELADTGTIFLDEIGEVPPSVQVKLLRVLETRSFFRLGGVQPINVDVRVVAATNRALRDRVALGEFRDDLYYRLNVLAIYLPPLRERRDDIPLLIARFVREFAAQHDRTFPGISADAMQRLVDAAWPGNVRQLRNLIESMVVLAPDSEIRAEDIPRDVTESARSLLPMRVAALHAPPPAGDRPWSGQEFEFILRSLLDLRGQLEELRHRLDAERHEVQVIEVTDPAVALPPVDPASPEPVPPPPPVVLYRAGMTMDEIERAAIEIVLKEERGNRRRAAQVLGIGERTLYRKLKQYQLD